MDKKKFRTAYVSQNTSHDFSTLLEICETIRFVATGYEKEEDLLPSLQESLKDYHPATDVIVPVGSVTLNALIGMVVGQLVKEHHYSTFRMAFFQDKEYHVAEIHEAIHV